MFFAENDFLFLGFVCVFVWVFKEAQFVFQLQDPENCLVHQFLIQNPLLYERCQVLGVDAGHHVNVNAGFGSSDGSFFSVFTVAVVNDLLNGCPVGYENSVKAHLLSQDLAHEPFIAGCRNSVYGVEGGHDQGCACVNAGFVRGKIKFTQGMFGKLYRIIIPACRGGAVPCKMLHTGCYIVGRFQVIPLEPSDHGLGEEAV